MTLASQDIKALAQAVIDTEVTAITALRSRINDDFIAACQCLLDCRGRIVVMGMGKSGHIGRKIAATFASTGSPAFFVHPAEASHGDLGMITDDDVVVALSNSGETSEILSILPLLKRRNIPLVLLAGRIPSTLARNATVCLDVSVSQEACPLGLAPTASTTAALVMGDALAVSLLEARGFTAEDFALSHPNGALGKRLLLHVSDVMHAGAALPIVSETAKVTDALIEMSAKGLGMTAVTNAAGGLIGVFTDGDLRRVIAQTVDLHTAALSDFITTGCKTVLPTLLAAEALALMEQHKINGLLVVDDAGALIGALNMHDLLRAGVV